MLKENTKLVVSSVENKIIRLIEHNEVLKSIISEILKINIWLGHGGKEDDDRLTIAKMIKEGINGLDLTLEDIDLIGKQGRSGLLGDMDFFSVKNYMVWVHNYRKSKPKVVIVSESNKPTIEERHKNAIECIERAFLKISLNLQFDDVGNVCYNILTGASIAFFDNNEKKTAIESAKINVLNREKKRLDNAKMDFSLRLQTKSIEERIASVSNGENDLIIVEAKNILIKKWIKKRVGVQSEIVKLFDIEKEKIMNYFIKCEKDGL